MPDAYYISEREEQSDYIDDLLSLLHWEGDGLVWGLKLCLDDSGSDDGSPLVTCGGPLLSYVNFRDFSKRWYPMYERNQFSGYTMEPPLKMADFVRSGKYAGLRVEFKRHLFLDVAKLINEYKLYSISIAVSQTDFRNELSTDACNSLIGPYAFAFFVLVLAHQEISGRLRDGPLRTAYLVDRGFGHQEQLNEAHALIVRFEKAMGGFRHTGALATDSDDNIPPLQAADAIAWASRQVELHGGLPEGFEPLAEVLSEEDRNPHQTIRIPRDGIRMWAVPVNNWISKHGTVPKFTDIVTRNAGAFMVKLKS